VERALPNAHLLQEQSSLISHDTALTAPERGLAAESTAESAHLSRREAMPGINSGTKVASGGAFVRRKPESLRVRSVEAGTDHKRQGYVLAAQTLPCAVHTLRARYKATAIQAQARGTAI
jgi:hypothetical protein